MTVTSILMSPIYNRIPFVMRTPPCLRSSVAALSLSLLLAFPLAHAAIPDFTATGVIAALKANPSYSSSPYNETFNLGATGLRGWIYDGGGQPNSAVMGLNTDLSRQILITVASAPASAVLAVDDVILGAMAGSTGTVPLFTSDSRKAIGVAITNAEKTGAGTLRVKRWRAGTTTDVNIAMTIMGDYTATAPYNCPKSTAILAAATTKLVAELMADPNFLTGSGYAYPGAIKALALMAGVVPGDANYATVQTRLQSYAQALTPANLTLNGCDTWNWAYVNIFLSEYYLRSVESGSPDAGVLAGINKYTVAMAKGQSRYGTFGHGGSGLKADGSLHGTIPPYGPVNCAGIAANLSIVFGKKALLAGSQTLDPEIDPAIERGSNFFKYYVNKGAIPYGEHEPAVDSHSFNGKEEMCAMFFALQGNRPVETEYFSRMSVAGYMGREEGHSGTGFNYMWEAMGANVGGPTAVAKYVEKILWNLDLERRTDGSFVYDGSQRTVGGGSTGDGTYLGSSEWQLMNPTANYILTYSLPLQRLYITGKNANPVHTLDITKVNNAIAAATYQLDCPTYSITQLIADLSQFDPVVRDAAAIELGKRSLSTGEVDTLIAMINSTNPNERMGACQAVGILQIPAALPLLSQRLSDPDLWVRGKAAKGLRSFSPTAASSELTPMLNAFIANATDPAVIAWDDPIQIANNFLSFALFGDAVYNGNNVASYTLGAPKNLLYPAVRAGLRQPDSNPRLGVSNFTYGLTLADAQALTPELFAAATTTALADTMWHGEARATAIGVLANLKAAEAIPLAVAMQGGEPGFGWGSHHYKIAAVNALASFGDSSRWTLPGLRAEALTLDTGSSLFGAISGAVSSIDAAITSPAGINNLMAVANPQVVTTGGAKAITLTGSSCRGSAVTFYNVTAPAHGTLTGTAPNLIYTPTANYIGPDFFTFQVSDTLTNSSSSTVSIIVGAAGTGLKGEYFDSSDFTNLKVTRTDPAVNFDWGTGSPDLSVGADTFSARWSGQLLVPETGNYTFSTLNSDGVRLYINGVPLIDDYVDQSTGWQDGTPISLTAGQKVELQMEYYENTGSAVAKLKWTGPSLGGLNGLPIAKEWLYDGTGIATRTAYAHAQSVTLMQSAPQAVTLTGSGATQTALTYAISTPPTNGTLSGTAPNLTYTPSSNYSGSDSFTFTVNNGTSTSAPATVSIGILAGLPTSYFWTNAVTGNWSGSFWTNAAGGSVTPAVAGNATYSLNFNQSGTYTTTQDLNNNYAFNQLNVGGNVTFAGTNSLSPTANGSLLPQINQNSGNSISFNAPLSLAAMTSFGGTGGGTVTIPSLISGAGGLTKTSPGTLNVTNISNTFSGGTVISKGTLYLDLQRNQGLGTGPITLNPNGTLLLNRIDASNALIFNGGAINADNGWGNSFSGLVTLNSTSTITGPFALTLSGTISGAGGFNKTGNGTLVLSGTNTFTGASSITAGTLQCNSAASVGSGAINITSGGKVSLNFTGTRTIAALSYNGGSALAAGTYGSTTSPATNKNDTYFAGNGTITILPASTTSLNLTTGSNPSTLGTSLTFTAAVTGTAPTGNVAFYDGTTLLASSALNGSFQASFTSSSLVVGTHAITAQYAGNANNAASTSAVLSIGINSVVPAVPSQLSATPLIGWIGLTWSASNGATSYQVKRSLTSGGPYTTIGTISGTSYTDTAVVNGTFYEYVVSAVTGTGTSANSAGVSATPIVPSAAKNILSFTFPSLPAANISGTNINVSVPAGSNVTSLAPTYTISAAASGAPASGTTRNFSSAQTYTITAEDGSIKVYNVTASVNVAPVATSQSVTAVEDIAKSITLAGTDANGDVLSYTVVTSPANGTLSGTAPNLIYTPTANYNGADSFTFKANDGLLDSAVATVNLTVTAVNDAPVALAQSVGVAINLARPMTLTGTDAEGNPLTYVVVTPPTNGSLSGTAPAVTYTPFNNYSGTDSFTFKTNDGTIDSAVATVNLTVTNLAFTWNSAIAGNWSDSTKWTVGSGSPNSTGLNGYILNFNTAGTYTATNDLSASFVLNQLNFGGSSVTLAGNGMVLAANGSTLPVINQNSSSSVTISEPVSLGSNVTVAGTLAGQLNLAGLVSGSGSLTKSNSGTLQLYGNLAANTYSGGTIVNSGTLFLGYYNGTSPYCSNPAGTGPVTLGAGTTIQFERVGASNALIVNGASSLYTPNGWGVDWSGPITLNATLTANTPSRLICGGAIGGTGGITKTSNGELYLSGSNNFTGATKIMAGTLTCSQSGALGAGSLDITSGAKVALNFSGTRAIPSLTYNAGAALPAGTYGSTASQATNKNDTYFTGVGMLTVGAINSAPVAAAQSVSTAEDIAKAITLTASDADGNPLTYLIVTPPVNGTLSGTAPNVTYTPSANYNGADSFTFKANDGTIDSATATVSITVTPVNDAPVAAAQSVTTAEDTAKAITLTATDVEGSALSYTIVLPPSNGSLSGTAPNVTYTPAANYNGADSFTFKANDGTIDSAAATVSITVTPVNDAPVATAQSVITAEGVALPITLAGTDVEANALTYAIVNPPANGTLSGSAPNVTYTPNFNYNGADSFTFKANDGLLDSAATTVSIAVTSVTFSWNSGIAGNWSDGTKWTAGSSPANSGLASYILNFNALGSYAATNDLSAGFMLNRINFGGSTATLAGNGLALVVNGSTLPQINQSSANSATISSNLALAANTTLGGSGAGALTLSGNISGGVSITKTTTGTLTLAGLNTYSGGTVVSSGTLNLAHQNGLGTGTVTLAAGTTFQQSNFEGNASAGALPNAFVLNGNVIMNIPFSYKDVWLSQAVSGAGGFTVQGGNRSLTLTANNSFSGGVILKNDNNKIQIAHINALGTGTFRTERTAAGSEGKLISFANLSTAPGVANAFDIAADAYLNVFADSTNDLLLSGAITSAVGSGHLYKTGTAKLTLSGVNTYTGSTTIAGGTLDCIGATALGAGVVNINSGGKLGLSFTGTRQIASLSLSGAAQPNGSYGSTASTATNKSDTYFSGTGTVTVGPLNTAPVASAQSVSTPEDIAKAITLTATDVDGNPLTYTLVAPPTSGTLSGTAPNVIYTPAPNSNGGDSFTFKANDGTLDSNVATVTITVAPVNDAPVAFAQSVSTAEDIAKGITLSASDVDSGALSYIIVTAPTKGTLSGTAPNLSYTPAANYNGADSFTFKANDGVLDSATVVVSITVTQVNDAPIAAAQSVTTAEDTAKAITLTATDVEGGALTYSIVSPPANGTLSGTAPNVTYTPAANYNGADSFTFKANDGSLDSATVAVSLTVTAVNDAPVFTANPIVAAGAFEGTAYTGQTLNGRATDADAGDTITYSKVSGPAWLAVATNGTLSGTPTLGSAGLNSFVVRATDSTAATADAGLQITVSALPLPWLTGDVGTGILAGSVSYNAGTFTQAGSGSLGTTSDKLCFTYQTLTGDGEIIAKISVLQDTGTSSRVGVMIRNTLATNSKQIFMGMSGTGTYRLVRRATTGGSNSTSNSSTGIVPNTWVRLVRSGTTITAYKGTNGTTWTSVGSTTVTMATNCYIGLAVSSGSNTILNTSQFSNLSVTP